MTNDIFIDARQYNVIGDGTTDNHTYLQNFVQALVSAGPGATGVLPSGVILTSGPLAYGAHSGIHIVGNGRAATILTKTGNFDLVQMNGSGTGQANHCSRCSLSNLGLSGTPPGGSTYTGRLIDCAYADNLIVHAVDLTSNNDVGIDTTETWDSHFDDVVCDAASSTTAPSIWIRSSRAASGFGQSSDTTNVIRLTNIRCESWKYGAIRMEQGTGGHAASQPDLAVEGEVRVLLAARPRHLHPRPGGGRGAHEGHLHLHGRLRCRILHRTGRDQLQRLGHRWVAA
ncbi:MAG: glycoside hydrolase family 55 protein [Actinomycetota bacterium]|nr:glycoside hydrolase family 55 protein [Actinomycetota bacterium]